ncbi:hypothetical protein IWX91DRAFT_178174 [Phyllosticta citricarpa]
MPCILPSAAASVASPYSSFRSVLALSSANPPENFDRDTAVARSRVNCQRCYECCVRSPGPLKAPLKPLCAIDQDLSNNAVIPSSPRFSVLVALVTSNFGPWLQPHSCHYTPPVPYYSYHVSFSFGPVAFRLPLDAWLECTVRGYECCVRSPVPLKASLTSLCASTPEYILNNTIILESPVPPALRCLARVHCQRCYECCVRSPVPLKASLTSLCASTPEDIMNNTIIL